MRPLLAVLLLSLARVASAAMHIDPIDPTSRSFVILQLREIWPEFCLPHTPRVERNGSAIEVVWSFGGCACTGNVSWNEDVEIGALPPGNYEIAAKVQYTKTGAIRAIGNRTLNVRTHDPAFTVTPNLIRTYKKTSVRIESVSYSFFCSTELEVTANGVPLRKEGCSWVMEPHPAGPVDIRVRQGETVYESFGAVHYVDPHAAPDPAVYERILVPVVLNAGGAFGSEWETHAKIFNTSKTAADLIPEVAGSVRLLGDSSMSLERFGEHPDGLLLFMPRTLAGAMRFSHMARTPRDRSQYGTEVPVVRERDLYTSRFFLPDVPFDSRYRVQLRVYGVDGATLPVSVGVRVDETTWVERPIDMKAPCATSHLPCNSNAPAFGTVDLGATFPWLVNGSTYRVYVDPRTDRHLLRYWAFISVTDNATQHVTVISPQ